jgi:hypothetical protein
VNEHYSVKRALLCMVVGGLVLAALAGIYVLLFGTFGETEAKILLTTLSVSYFSVTSLACAALYEKKRHALLAVPGLAVSVVGFVLFLVTTWGEWWRSEPVFKTLVVLAIFSFSFAQACLLSFPTLQRRVAWVYYAAVAAILTLAALVSAMLLSEPQDGEWVLRITGAVAILDGCLSLCVPVLHRLGRKSELPTTAKSYQQIELVCPRCGQRGTHPIGSIRCRRCLLAIDVHIEAESREPTMPPTWAGENRPHEDVPAAPAPLPHLAVDVTCISPPA